MNNSAVIASLRLRAIASNSLCQHALVAEARWHWAKADDYRAAIPYFIPSFPTLCAIALNSARERDMSERETCQLIS